MSKKINLNKIPGAKKVGSLKEIKDAFTKQFFGATSEEVQAKQLCMTCQAEVTGFRDAISEKEYHISGMCQACQDEMFGHSDWKYKCEICGKKVERPGFCAECQEMKPVAWLEWQKKNPPKNTSQQWKLDHTHLTLEGDRKWCKTCHGMSPDPTGCPDCIQLSDCRPRRYIGNE